MLSLLSVVLFAGVPAGAADAVYLKDSKVLLGQVAAPTQPGKLGLIVRRDWVRKNFPERAEVWEKRERAMASLARQQRLLRLEAWRRERPDEPADRIVPYLDAEIARLRGKDDTLPPLLRVELPASAVRRVDRKDAATARLLRQGWRAGLDEPEALPIADLRSRLEGRGFALSEVDPAPLDDLLAFPLESEPQWVARRAATEVRDDRSLWFIRYQGLVLPEDAGAGDLNLAALAGKAITDLLNPEPPADPLAPRFREAEARGRVGLVLTTLEISPELTSARVEAALLVRLAPGRWVPAIVQPAEVAAGNVQPDAADAIANDPQVRAVFRAFDALGLGEIGQDAQRRSLAVGAATRQALGLAKSGCIPRLDELSLPVNR